MEPHTTSFTEVSFGTIHASFGVFADDTKGKVMANRGWFVSILTLLQVKNLLDLFHSLTVSCDCFPAF